MLKKFPQNYSNLERSTMAKNKRMTFKDEMFATRPRKRIEIFDSKARGLGVRQSAAGQGAFFYVYNTTVNGKPKRRRYTLGHFPAMTVDEARKEIIKVRAQVRAGGDPVLEERRERERAANEWEGVEAPRTFGAAVDLYLVDRVFGPKGHKHPDKTKQIFDRYLVSKWDSRPLKEITKTDASTLLKRVKSENGAVMANRVYAYARAFFGWCAEESYIEQSPILGMKRPGGTEDPRERKLEDHEIVAVWRAAEKLDYPLGHLTRILLLLGQRRTETAGMRWRDLRLKDENPRWLIPASMTKNGKQHSVPLPPLAVEIIESCKRIANSDGVAAYVFTYNGDTPMNSFSRGKSQLDFKLRELAEIGAVEEIIEPFRFHDLRRTLTTGLAALKIPDIVIDKVENRAPVGITQRVYNRHEYTAEKREALALREAH
ncbi:MAG: site-specific integrase [Alphaproteobacteria bacterium]|nr:site-specific integrase [Alphaproteobacteria bacterium]